MRDVHKLKEKFELSLDTRQIFTLVVVGLVSLGGVFVLGVAVGRKVATDEKVAQPGDLLSQLDEKQTAMTTFQDELTKPAPKETPRAAKPVEAPKPVEPKPEPAVVAAAVAPEPKPEPKAAAVKPATEPEPSQAAKLSDDPVTTRTTSVHDAGALKDAIARAQRPVETTADGSWTLQLSAYQDKAEAERFAADLRGRGYAPFVVEATVGGKGTWYRVRMGRFPSKDAAGRYLADFRRETQIEAIVTTAN